MFVDITNPKSPLAVENILTPYKKGRLVSGIRQPKEKISPDVCIDILKSTNYARNIKDMLLCIAELPLSEQAQFIFKNRAQMEESRLVLPKKWKGLVCFKDNPNDVIQAKQDSTLGAIFGKLFAKGGR